jgi:hypothetical protein
MLNGFIEGLISFNWLFGLFMSLASSMVLRMITIDDYKNEVGRLVNAEIYRRIMIEYRKMERDRGFGLVAVLAGLILFYVQDMFFLVHFPDVDYLQFLKDLIIPVLVTFAGYLCYQKAFMKAMGLAISEMDQVYSGGIYRSSK